MIDFLRQLEESGLSTWVRETNSLLAYPGVLFLHTVGMAFAAGLSALIDLRMLGRAPEVPLAEMRRVLPYMWAGVWLSAATGVVLFALDATTKAVNPVFYTKLAFIAMAVGVCLVQRRIIRDPLVDDRPIETKGKLLAFTSIICWIGAIAAGRLLAYLGPGTVSPGG